MVGYTTLGTNKWDEALAFYDALTAEIGGKRLMELEDFIVFGTTMEKGCIAIVPPFDKKPATVGNGVMVALQCESEDDVKKLYGKALEATGDTGAAIDAYERGIEVAEGKGDKQAAREMTVFLKRLRRQSG